MIAPTLPPEGWRLEPKLSSRASNKPSRGPVVDQRARSGSPGLVRRTVLAACPFFVAPASRIILGSDRDAVNIDPTWLFVTLIPSGAGLVLFVYGKKQRRGPQLAAGLALHRSFRLFTDEFDSWWPRTHHISKSPMKRAIIDGRTGGRCYTEQVDGTAEDR